MDLFFIKIRGIFHRVKYLSLIVLLYIMGEIRIVTANGGYGKWWQFAVFYLIDVFFFYLNCYFVFPSAYLHRKTIYKPFLFIILTLVLHYLLTVSAFAFFQAVSSGFMASLTPPVLTIYAWRVLIVAILAAVPFGFFTFIKVLKQQKTLENNILYSRISPHLIFNSLNFIQADLRNISAKADEMITCLSEYSRYAMVELAEDGKANLEAELTQLNILLRMNELRFDKIYLSLQLDLSQQADAYRIPPHLILSLAENVFKYGAVSDPAKPALISVADQGRLLYVNVSNWKERTEGVISHKQGLDNLKKRLKNIYNDFFTMKIEENADSFNVYIIIPI